MDTAMVMPLFYLELSRAIIVIVINLSRFKPSATLPGAKPLSSLGQAFLKKFDKTGLEFSPFLKRPYFGLSGG
jgi:hypothetical protein